jgi:thiol-disulfide isomerase/thioredoxin
MATKFQYLVALLLMVLVGAGCSSSVSRGALVGQPAPRYTPFFMVEDEPLVLEHLRGKTVVVMFWATTCAKSQTSIEEFNRYVQRYGAAKGLVGVAVSIDKQDDYERVTRRIRAAQLESIRHSFSGNDIYDQAKIAFDVDVLPSFFVISPEGTIIAAGTDFEVVTRALGA